MLLVAGLPVAGILLAADILLVDILPVGILPVGILADIHLGNLLGTVVAECFLELVRQPTVHLDCQKKLQPII